MGKGSQWLPFRILTELTGAIAMPYREIPGSDAFISLYNTRHLNFTHSIKHGHPSFIG
jgi:hypothetical protein